jgi:hypothetical protein
MKGWKADISHRDSKGSSFILPRCLDSGLQLQMTGIGKSGFGESEPKRNGRMLLRCY